VNQPPSRRSAVFAYSDIRNAAEDFVVAISEYPDTIWEDYDVNELAESLAQAALVVLRNRTAIFGHVGSDEF
jgi:hypothetical protein